MGAHKVSEGRLRWRRGLVKHGSNAHIQRLLHDADKKQTATEHSCSLKIIFHVPHQARDEEAVFA